jgi:hypothetical protein
MKLKEKKYLRKRKKIESTGLTRQTWDWFYEIERKNIFVF